MLNISWRNTELIGGNTEEGEPIAVEIDESYFFRRKYNRGVVKKVTWVFGAIERETGLCFLQAVPNRTEQTLQNLIAQWILPGSIIYSDGWAAYAHIEEINNGVYQDEVIIHKDT